MYSRECLRLRYWRTFHGNFLSKTRDLPRRYVYVILAQIPYYGKQSSKYLICKTREECVLCFGVQFADSTARGAPRGITLLKKESNTIPKDSWTTSFLHLFFDMTIKKSQHLSGNYFRSWYPDLLKPREFPLRKIPRVGNTTNRKSKRGENGTHRFISIRENKRKRANSVTQSTVSRLYMLNVMKVCQAYDKYHLNVQYFTSNTNARRNTLNVGKS